MSRIGKKPIIIPKSIELSLGERDITVKGPKGELKAHPPSSVLVFIEDDKVQVKVDDPPKKQKRALWGLWRQLINNMIEGVTKGFEKKLELKGIGYKASLTGNQLVLNLGYSHPIEFKLPSSIKTEIDKNIITISGIDKQLVGEVSSQIRRLRPPEPYKGKGIRYLGEVIKMKPGKAAKAVGVK